MLKPAQVTPLEQGTIQNPSMEGNYSPPPLNSLYSITAALLYCSSYHFPNTACQHRTELDMAATSMKIRMKVVHHLLMNGG